MTSLGESCPNRLLEIRYAWLKEMLTSDDYRAARTPIGSQDLAAETVVICLALEVL